MGFFTFEYSDEFNLKLQIKTIVENWGNKGHYTVTGSGVNIVYNKFEIRLETDSNCSRLYSFCYVKFNGKEIFCNNDEVNKNDYDFLLDLCKIVYKKEKLKQEEEKKLEILNKKNKEEEKKLSRQILVSEALASITGLELQKVSKEVKEEFNPIFDKVKRVVEITKELEDIRKEFSIV